MTTESAAPERVQDGARDTRPFLMGWCAYVLAMAFFGVVVLRTLSPRFDFSTYYAAGVLVRTDPAHLYDLAAQQQVQDTRISPRGGALPFLHPSYEALLYVPFSLLPYKAAYFSYVGFNLLLLLAVFYAGYPIFSTPVPVWQARPGLMILFFVPVMVTIWQGQDSLLFLLTSCLVWRALAAGRDARAGWVLALGLFKFQLAVPMAIVVAARRGWRFAAAFAAAGVGVAALCLGMMGRAGAAALLHLLVAGSLARDQGAAAQQAMVIKPPAMPNLVGLLYACGTRHLAAGAAFAVVAAVSAAVLGWSIFAARRARQLRVAYAIAMVCAVLVSYHLFLYDVTLLLAPMALLGAETDWRILLTLFGLPAILLLFTGPQWLFLLALPTLALLASAGWKAGRDSGKPALAEPERDTRQLGQS